jgi:hypothetical protein
MRPVAGRVPCEYVVAEYLNGEDQLPRLRAAVDAVQAIAIASCLAASTYRPVVKVFALRECGSQLLFMLRL